MPHQIQMPLALPHDEIHLHEVCGAEVISAYKLAKKSPVADYLQGVKDGSVHLDTGAFNQIIRSCLQAEDVVRRTELLEM